MTEFPLTDWETRRITALYQLEILDTPAEKEYDHLVALAAQVCGKPIATLGFIDHDRTWFKAAVGIKLQEYPTHAAYPLGESALILPIQIEDTLLDERSADNIFVLDAPYVRSVTIFPLVTEEGVLLGHLSVADTKPGLLTDAQFNALEMLSLQTMSLLKLRLQIIRMQQVQKNAKRTLDHISPVFKNAIDAVIITGQDDIICQWNPRAEELFGYTAKEAIGQYFHSLLIPIRKHQAFFEARRELKVNAEGPDNKRYYELLAKRKDNVELVVAVGVSPVVIDNQPLFICFVSDITERRQIARELAKQKSFYENILNKIPMDIAVFNADHQYLYLNFAAIQQDKLREYIIGKDDFDYAAYRKRDNTLPLVRRRNFIKAKITGKGVTWEDQLKTKEGKPVTLIRSFFPVHDDEGNFSFMIGHGVDITERKKLEEEQNYLLERLSFQNTQLVDFCNIVTHNLRGPLNNMSMLVDFIEESEEPGEQKELVLKLKPVIESLKFTFNELVETIQIKQDLEIKCEVVNLENCLNQALQGLEMEILIAGAQLHIDCSAAPEVYYPPKYVSSIFHNLVSNALKYRSPDRVLQINIATERRGSSIFLTVADNGLGIDMGKHKDHIFKIGKVFHSHANAKGLGLYMTKSQVEVMGGTIEVESEVDKGAVFTVEFKDDDEGC